MRVAIITSSDSGYAGQREDVSGPVIEEIVTASGYRSEEHTSELQSHVMI